MGGIFMNKTKKKKGNIFIIILIFILIIGVLFMLFKFSNKVQYNNTPINGNTTGNLNNSGMVCESNGILYFANAYDYNSLYSYNPDNGKCKKLSDGPVKCINVDSHYIYFVRDISDSNATFGISTATFRGLYRMDINGKHKICLHSGAIGNAQLINNKIFFQNYSNDYGYRLYSIEINGKNEKEVLQEPVNPTGYYDNALVFCNAKENHNVVKMNPETEQKETVYEGNCYFPIIQNDFLYFMDVENNYSLARVNLKTNEKTTLTTERLDTYNLYEDTIFYQVSDKDRPCLKRMKTDGSNIELVYNGIFNNINITKNYTYFTAYNNTTPIFRTPTTGVVDVTVFSEALDAVQ